MESRGMLLACCVAMALVLLSGECQANYYYVPSPGPTLPPARGGSSAVPPSQPTTFPMVSRTTQDEDGTMRHIINLSKLSL
uniref:Uncharacterized protein n=1 Tax=Arundo donax TaxID=35708 RepID=A0A0A9HJT6_ARUDO